MTILILTLWHVLYGWGILIILMMLAWLFARRYRNAGIVDVVWAGGYSILAIFYAASSQGYPLRKLLIAGMMGLAGLRLCIHLAQRFCAEFPKEDARYGVLRQAWGDKKADLGFLWVFQLQGLLMAVNSVPVALACLNASPSIHIIEWLSVGLWMIGFIGEAIADRQLTSFKAERSHHGTTCQVGLWRYSRHPNYFFEWLMWVAYFGFALGSPWGWLTLYVPVLMLFFLIKVTGIAMSEAQSRQSKPDYAHYQATTSAFIPWFPR